MFIMRQKLEEEKAFLQSNQQMVKLQKPKKKNEYGEDLWKHALRLKLSKSMKMANQLMQLAQAKNQEKPS